MARIVQALTQPGEQYDEQLNNHLLEMLRVLYKNLIQRFNKT